MITLALWSDLPKKRQVQPVMSRMEQSNQTQRAPQQDEEVMGGLGGTHRGQGKDRSVPFGRE